METNPFTAALTAHLAAGFAASFAARVEAEAKERRERELTAYLRDYPTWPIRPLPTLAMMGVVAS